MVVLEESRKNKYGQIMWLCQCDCGNKTTTRSSRLCSGETMSCGCYQREISIKINTTHGFRFHPLYYIWNSMMGRCYNPNAVPYKDYGGRGIKICQEWRHNPENFIKWAITNGWEKGLQIDRINNDKGYTPENCRFVSGTEQKLNSRLLQINNTSGFRGVTWSKANRKYKAVVRLYRVQYYLGYYATATEAAKARDVFVIERGLHTPLNFPDI